jgi:PPOX class probable FMN-dependent enzyme
MTPERLAEIYGAVHEKAAAKVIYHLDHHCRDFMAASPFVVWATSDGTNLDVSPKGDPAGFIKVVDDHHLEIPDRPGNNRLDGLLNILKHPKVAIIFLIPTVGETLRVNGHAEIVEDQETLEAHAMNDRLPLTVTRVKVEKVLSHCGKAPLRAGLWKPETWPAARPVAGLYDIIRDHAQMDAPDMTEAQVEKLYKDTLY